MEESLQVDVTSFAAAGEEAEEEQPYKWQVSNGKGEPAVRYGEPPNLIQFAGQR